MAAQQPLAVQPLAVHQSAPAMLIGNLQNCAVPLCPLTTWCGGRKKDAETMITLLDPALEANGALSIQEQPARHAAVLLQCCCREQMAQEFLTNLRAISPNSSVPEIKQAFLERFQSEVRTRAARPETLCLTDKSAWLAPCLSRIMPICSDNRLCIFQKCMKMTESVGSMPACPLSSSLDALLISLAMILPQLKS